MTKEGAIAGMVAGLAFTFLYIAWFKLWFPEADKPENWLFGISSEGIGVVGMVINFAVASVVAKVTAPVPQHVQRLVATIRVPKGAEAPHMH